MIQDLNLVESINPALPDAPGLIFRRGSLCQVSRSGPPAAAMISRAPGLLLRDPHGGKITIYERKIITSLMFFSWGGRLWTEWCHSMKYLPFQGNRLLFFPKGWRRTAVPFGLPVQVLPLCSVSRRRYRFSCSREYLIRYHLKVQ